MQLKIDLKIEYRNTMIHLDKIDQWKRLHHQNLPDLKTVHPLPTHATAQTPRVIWSYDKLPCDHELGHQVVRDINQCETKTVESLLARDESSEVSIELPKISLTQSLCTPLSNACVPKSVVSKGLCTTLRTTCVPRSV